MALVGTTRQATGRPTQHYCYVFDTAQSRVVGHACSRGYHMSIRTRRIDSHGHRVWVSGAVAAQRCADKAAARGGAS